MAFELEAGDRPESVRIVQDDTSGLDDTVLSLVHGGVSRGGVLLRTSEGGAGRVRFTATVDLLLWHPGINRFQVVVVPAHGPVQVTAHEWTFDSGNWLASSLTDTTPLVLELPAEVPMLAEDCPATFCVDADGDGLLDAWENAVLERLRPVYMFDTDEELLTTWHGVDHLATIGRVSPARDTATGESYVAVLETATFSQDYGVEVCAPLCFHVFGHSGDTQPFGLLWLLVSRDSAELDRLFAAVHVGAVPPRGEGWVWSSPDASMFDAAHPEAPRWSPGHLGLYVEDDKHGLWPDLDACRDISPYDCDNRVSVTYSLPPVFNVGESPDIGQPLVDRLSAAVEPEPHAPLGWWFPGEAVWGEAERADGRDVFCGGYPYDGGCAVRIGGHLSRLYVFGRPLEQEPRSWPATTETPAGAGASLCGVDWLSAHCPGALYGRTRRSVDLSRDADGDSVPDACDRCPGGDDTALAPHDGDGWPGSRRSTPVGPSCGQATKCGPRPTPSGPRT